MYENGQTYGMLERFKLYQNMRLLFSKPLFNTDKILKNYMR